MADFDVEAYYAEQDEHMNLPDEDTGEFIKRVSSFRQRCVHVCGIEVNLNVLISHIQRSV